MMYLNLIRPNNINTRRDLTETYDVFKSKRLYSLTKVFYI